MKQIIGVGITIAVCCLGALAADIPRHLVVLGGAFGNIEVAFTSPAGMIRGVLVSPKCTPTEFAAATNINCVLAVGNDGAVQALTFDGPGRYDVDFLTRLIDARTGVLHIENPKVVLEGGTNDIVAVWAELARTDRRFVVNRLPTPEANGSNRAAHATAPKVAERGRGR